MKAENAHIYLEETHLTDKEHAKLNIMGLTNQDMRGVLISNKLSFEKNV